MNSPETLTKNTVQEFHLWICSNFSLIRSNCWILGGEAEALGPLTPPFPFLAEYQSKVFV